MKTTELAKKAHQIRKDVLGMCVRAKTGHVTSSFSCVEMLVALFYGGVLRFDPKNPSWPERDRFLLSKAQASPALYTILADLGFYDRRKLSGFARKDGMCGVHLQYNVPGVEITAGSLGHGFGIATGIALGAKMDRDLFLTFALLGDGECHEGSVWETAMFAAHNRLNNLVAIVDRNYMCATDFTENIVALEPIDAKWASFGWNVARINGNNMDEVMRSLQNLRSRRSSQPLVIISDTVKGAGVESISNVPLWHALAPQGKMVSVCNKALERERLIQ